MSSILIIRHELSEANNEENYGTPAFGAHDAPLMPKGRLRAPAIGQQLVSDYGVILNEEVVATSMMRRTQETAVAAGFRWLHLYECLNEEKGGLSNSEILHAISDRNPPTMTQQVVDAILHNPPAERIWFTHGLIIATLCQKLGVHQEKRFIPRFGEIRELEISD